MINRFIYILLLLLLVTYSKAQQPDIDSLRHEIQIAQNDTVKMVLFATLTEAYKELKSDSSFYFGEQILPIARKFNFKVDEADALAQMGYALMNMGNYPRSLQILLSALAIAEDPKSERNILPDKYSDPKEFLMHPLTARMLRLSVLSRTNQILGVLYHNTNNYEKELFYYLKAIQFGEQSGNVRALCT